LLQSRAFSGAGVRAPIMADAAALNARLADSSYLNGAGPTQEDFSTWRSIPVCPELPHLARWWKHIESLQKLYPLRAWPKGDAGKKEGPKDAANLEGTLVGAEHGKVVTRFPPEPSGYLHIGHAKAALLNFTYAETYGGKMLLRFDDTNPSKEKMEYQESIVEDLKTLKITHEPTTYTSDYIGMLDGVMETMILAGKAYADDTDADQMKVERDAGTPSKCRDLPAEENVRRFKEMLKGSDEGLKYCIRGKIDMQCLNKCMRDPVFYRCKVDEPHHRHGWKYKAYPTYDFCCAIIDSHEGVTHALRSLEYSDRKAMYHWVLENTGYKRVELTEFSRMNFDYTVLSKRKLTKLVDQGTVTGWDDPRMPTLRGVLRRGLTVEALKEFVMTQGASRNTNSMSWDKIWAINKQKIDPIIPRYCALEKQRMVKLTLSGAPAKPTAKAENLHPKNPDMGTKEMLVASTVYLRQEDAQVLTQGEEVTLMHWGNAVVEGIEKNGDEVASLSGRLNLDGNPKTTKYKLNWLPDMEGLVEVTLRELGYLFLKPTFEADEDPMDFINPNSLKDYPALGEPAMKALKKGDRLQLERGAYYIVDEVNPLILIEIPDGRAKKLSGEARDDTWKAKEKGPKGAEAKAAAKSGAAAKNGAADRPLDDISRLDIRVGRITKAWPHPEADKLWCEEIDVGRPEPLAVCSGLRDHFTQEQMQGRLVTVIVNMKPAKMRGVESQGMVLCSTGEGGVEILAPPEKATIGERVTFAGHDGAPDEVLQTKTGKAPLEAIKPHLRTNGNCEATFKGVPFATSAGPVTTASNKEAPIS